MAVFRTVGPGPCACSQPALSYVLTGLTPSFQGSEYASPVLQARLLPRYFWTVNQSSVVENRRFFLERSIFDLVHSHQYLSLTDPKLLGWYLCLSQEDRKHIQDEGGFQLFLQRHPALELSQHHVYVKYNVAHTSPTMTTHQHCIPLTGLNPPAAPDTRRYKAPPLYQLESSSWQMPVSSSAAVCRDPSLMASFPVDMELERGEQRSAVSALQSSWSTAESESTCYSCEYVEAADLEDSSITDSSMLEPPLCLDHSDGDKGGVNTEDSGDIFSSLMEEDGSILACVPGKDASDQPATKVDAPPVTTCEVMVGTEPAQCRSTSTQTEPPGTSDKDVITEVQMSDLDYLAQEFIKLKSTKDELKEQNDRINSCWCSGPEECVCLRRAQRAEMNLLALQFSMCRQHCCRLYNTCTQGDLLTASQVQPPADLLPLLDKLQSDFNLMRTQICAGVPLETLSPLSVDCENIIRRSRYSPAQISEGVLGEETSGSSLETRAPDAAVGGCSDGQSANSWQSPRTEKHDGAERDATLVLKEEHSREHRQPAPPSSSEVWYDAEEDLQPAEMDTETGSAPQDAESCVLFVTNLPNHLTKADLMLWLGKHQASQVQMSHLQSGLRVARVTIRGLKAAEEAVRELDGCSVFGRSLHVELRSRPAAAASHTTDCSRESESTSTDTPSSKKPPLSCGVQSRKLISASPTLKRTLMPQHYCTLGSFDSLMSQLMQRHPDAGRQQILDALMELKAKHGGSLSVLPLRTIRDMMSELLTRPPPP